MIQRKQTLFLLAVAIIAIIQFFIPFQTLTSGTVHPVNILPGSDWIVKTSNIYYPFILNISIIVLSIICIMLYKNRILQYKLTNLLMLFNIFLIGLFFVLGYTIEEAGNTISYQFGSFLPLVSAVIAYLSAHFIKKDEQLVRSADRIR